MDAKQNISSIRHFLKKRHWVSDVFAGMCLPPVPLGLGSVREPPDEEISLDISTMVAFITQKRKQKSFPGVILCLVMTRNHRKKVIFPLHRNS